MSGISEGGGGIDTLQARPRAIIFDLGDVLFAWSANTATTIPARSLREILSTPIWHSYERGEITRDACYERSARQLSLPMPEIAEAFVQARKSLQPNYDLVSFINNLKEDASIRVYAMSNIGKEDFEELSEKLEWRLFDRVFTSAAAGMRKPDPGFYRHVLDQIGLLGSQVVFIDDKEENIHAARVLGIQGHVFGPSTITTLRQVFQSPVGRGWGYLFRNARSCESVTDSGITFADNFARLLIADSLQDHTLTNVTWGSRLTWNFFAGKAVLVPGGYFPDDLDTTSLALKTLRPPSTEIVASILDTMMRYVNDDGTFRTFYDPNKINVDAIASANILACFYSYGRGHELERTLQLVHSMLLDRSYLQGTRYYPSPDCCLGFIGRLVQSSDDPHLQATLGPLLKLRVCERLGVSGSALDYAMRIITCAQMGVACESDRLALLDLQCEDGGWEGGWLYQYGSSGVKIANRGVTTAMAVVALSS
ncbi:HAD-like protein [Xylaria grammica]|nr:HAD-like protein [Xylaria grammica]